MQRQERFSSAERVITVGFWINAILMVVKLAAGYFGNSEAVLADGLESAADFIALGATFIALRVSRQHHDVSHPYGHGKAESIAALLVSLIITITGMGILYIAIRTLATGRYPHPELMAVLAAVFTVVTKELLFRYTIKVGDQLGSPAVIAIARDHRKDALTSVATVIGVTGAYAGLPLLDPLAAGLTAVFILRIGYQTFSHATHDLMDGQPPADLLGAMAGIAENVAGVEHVHEIRGRRSGQYLIIDLKLEMDPHMTVKQSHAIATEVKKEIFSRFAEVGDVMIHINPHEEEHEDLIRL
jgi:cation diffusion facilitator family transporter